MISDEYKIGVSWDVRLKADTKNHKLMCINEFGGTGVESSGASIDGCERFLCLAGNFWSFDAHQQNMMISPQGSKKFS